MSVGGVDQGLGDFECLGTVRTRRDIPPKNLNSNIYKRVWGEKETNWIVNTEGG